MPISGILTMHDRLALIGFEWTGTLFRAWGFDEAGEIIGAAEATESAAPQPGDFASRTRYHLNEWLGGAPAAPIIGCGDIGRLAGTGPLPALTLPQMVPAIAGHLALEGGLHIVPWLRQPAPADLSGGAETALAGLDEPNGAVCLAGRHTRHVTLEHGRITGLSTEITGELRDLLLSTGVLAIPPGIVQAFDARVFRDWVERALDTDDTPPVFAVLAARQMGHLAPEHQAAALSGLLIGADVAAHYDPGDEVILAADGPLLDAYGIALDALGADVEECSAIEVIQDGLFELADLAGLLGD